MERRLAEQAEQERRRIGQALHDNLGQQMSALSMLASNVQQQLQEQSWPEPERMSQLVHVIEDAKTHVRALSQGLLPVGIDAEGLMNALRELTAHSEQMFGVACIFDCQQPVRIDDSTTATHLYHIAQEALNNAARHAQPEQIFVRLQNGDGITLQVRDDGIGMPTDLPTASGRGLQIMRYRAVLIGATLSVMPAEGGGTVVTCSLPGRERHGEG
jgi:two-component system CheB/CheR fusion protein